MTTLVKLVWSTPEAEPLLVNIARVSNPASQEAGENIDRLIGYMIRNGHWSPFEMVHACVEINTTRDIGRQILRHRSFGFQEFSQRYADVGDLVDSVDVRDLRLQDSKNRQNSFLCASNDPRHAEWATMQANVIGTAFAAYAWAIKNGVAKEVARAVLPEGLTPTRMYMVGSLRSWLHYLVQRTAPATQWEHRVVATAIAGLLQPIFPITFQASCSSGMHIHADERDDQ